MPIYRSIGLSFLDLFFSTFIIDGTRAHEVREFIKNSNLMAQKVGHESHHEFCVQLSLILDFPQTEQEFSQSTLDSYAKDLPNAANLTIPTK